MLRRVATRLAREPLAVSRAKMQGTIATIPEFVQFQAFRDGLLDAKFVSKSASQLEERGSCINAIAGALAGQPQVVTPEQLGIVLDAALLTFALHVESRITSLLGHAFYTIGPCGEELLAPIGLLLRDTDPMALHYRHLSIAIARNLRKGEGVESILLNRARGYVVAATDPVTGGRHCAIGGGSHDFIVTSTLASQSAPAVGRAVSGPLCHKLGVKSPFPRDAVSFVSVGDGSVSNAHFLGAENLAEYAEFQKIKVPMVFCITDNGLSISLKSNGFLRTKFAKKLQMPVFNGRGSDAVSVWLAARGAIDEARRTAKPTALILDNITRRFGHAATDRQNAYLSQQEIKSMASTNDVAGFCAQMVHAGLITQAALAERLDNFHGKCMQAFEAAHQEPKITSREMASHHVSAPLVPMPELSPNQKLVASATAVPDERITPNCLIGPQGTAGAKALVLRKHMNAVFDEALFNSNDVIYVGEDVVHGGYYIVSENLAKKYPFRVFDFPPDEGSMIGCAMGFAQGGLVPVVEIPYAKYLDCGFDMLTEAAIMSWLSCGKQLNGMVFRLQGFGRGVFGGNYHTHNMLSMPPGVDVICHSNGPNYARAMRYAIRQARHGRVVMSVDSTELLNMREAAPGISWEFELTANKTEVTFDDVFLYRAPKATSSGSPRTSPDVVVVTYGNGVIAALQAQASLRKSKNLNVDVLECPLLSSVPKGLKELVRNYSAVLFADPCKEGQHPLASHLTALMNEGLLPQKVRCVAAPRTYNPLGNTLTFLGIDDIVGGINALL